MFQLVLRMIGKCWKNVVKLKRKGRGDEVKQRGKFGIHYFSSRYSDFVSNQLLYTNMKHIEK